VGQERTQREGAIAEGIGEGRMSSYTTMIFTCGPCDSIAGKIEELNTTLEALGIPVFQGVPDTSIFGMSGNYLPVRRVVDVVNGQEWYNTHRLQLFERSEHDEKFTELEVHGFDTPNPALFSNDSGQWWKGPERPYLEPAVAVAEKVFGSVTPVTVMAVIQERLGKLEEYIEKLDDEERKQILGVTGGVG